jgi:hypothetical protein
MDIRNILNKDAAGDNHPTSESESDKSSSAAASPKSTASAPVVSTTGLASADDTSWRVDSPSSLPRGRPPGAPPIPLTRDFVCGTCQKTFARRSDLVRHGIPSFPDKSNHRPYPERIHSGLR